MLRNILVKNFESVRPHYEVNQENFVKNSIKIHYQSYLKQNEYCEKSETISDFEKNIFKYTSKKNRVKKRSFFLPDLLEEEPSKRMISNTNENFRGANLSERIRLYENISKSVLNEFYNEKNYQPDLACYVNNTGYTAPAPLNTYLAVRDWNKTVAVNLNHVGCYGAFPAIRLSHNYVLSEYMIFNQEKQADIVHVESSIVFYDPSAMCPSDLIAQGLFADGAIKYSVVVENEQNKDNSLKILAIHEKTIPNSNDLVNFRVEDHCFTVWMSKELPDKVVLGMEDFMFSLCERANLNFEEIKHEAVFAIHPGGPKIVDNIVERFSLKDWQIEHSYWVLENCGNMVSATLPHVLDRILMDDKLKNKIIISVGMSPGMVLGGAIFQLQ